MKFKFGAYIITLTWLTMILSACEGGSDTTASVAVNSLNNPVLANYSTVVFANFSNYTTYVKFGSPITFTVSPFPASNSNISQNTATFSRYSTITKRTVRTDVGGMAWITIRSPLPGKFIVRADSAPLIGPTSFGGSTNVSFIDQPAAVAVFVGIRKPLTNVGTLIFDLISTEPAPSFVNFVGIESPLIFAQDTEPIIPGTGVATTNLLLNSLKGINLSSGTSPIVSQLNPLFEFDYVPVPPSVPNFTLANIICNSSDLNATPLKADMVIIRTDYYDAAGNLLFH